MKGIIIDGAHIFVEEVTIKGIKEAINPYRTTDLIIKLEKYHGNKTDEMFGYVLLLGQQINLEWNIEEFLPKIECLLLLI